MKIRSIVLVLGACVLFATPLLAQTPIEIQRITRLFERPNATSNVTATLPVGLVLSQIAVQDGWIAVSMKNGKVGWIEASALTAAPATSPANSIQPSSSSEIDDLFESLESEVDRASTNPGSQVVNAPTSGSSTPSSNQVPPPPVSGNPTTPPPTRPEATSNPQSSSSSTMTPPPPPPARPQAQAPRENQAELEGPSTRIADTIEMVQAWKGRFNADSWSSLAVLLNEFSESAELSWANMKDAKLEWGGLINGLRSKSIDPDYQVGIGGFANYYFLSPTPNAPYGIFVGPRLNLTKPLGDEGSGISLLQYGAEAGVYVKWGDKTKIIPQLTFALAKGKLLESNSNNPTDGFGAAAKTSGLQGVQTGCACGGGEDTHKRVVIGADFIMGRFAPGFKAIFEGDERKSLALYLTVPF